LIRRAHAKNKATPRQLDLNKTGDQVV